MNGDPFWSVAIPSYNRPELLAKALDSVARSSKEADRDLEIVVFDDGSKPPVEDVRPDIPFTLIRSDINVGQCEARNRAVEACRGEWIHLLHDDDTVSHDFYRRFEVALETLPDGVGALFCDQHTVNENGDVTWKSSGFRSGVQANYFYRLLGSLPVAPPSVVMSAQAYEIGGRYLELGAAVDWHFYKRVARHYDWAYVPGGVGYYLRHDGTQRSSRIALGERVGDFLRSIIISEHEYKDDPRAMEACQAARIFHSRRAFRDASASLRYGIESCAMILTDCMSLFPSDKTRTLVTDWIKKNSLPLKLVNNEVVVRQVGD